MPVMRCRVRGVCSTFQLCLTGYLCSGEKTSSSLTRFVKGTVYCPGRCGAGSHRAAGRWAWPPFRPPPPPPLPAPGPRRPEAAGEGGGAEPAAAAQEGRFGGAGAAGPDDSVFFQGGKPSYVCPVEECCSSQLLPDLLFLGFQVLPHQLIRNLEIVSRQLSACAECVRTGPCLSSAAHLEGCDGNEGEHLEVSPDSSLCLGHHTLEAGQLLHEVVDSKGQDAL
ncbi:hypothetical protein MUG91_G193n8 [Manis pentadactyla]|nr:hypothetical protein MUG91_G193n8 [Manis pentadactyla]